PGAGGPPDPPPPGWRSRRSTTPWPVCRTARCSRIGCGKPSLWRAGRRRWWRCSTWTWTASNSSTIPWVITSEIYCCNRWPSGWRTPCGIETVRDAEIVGERIMEAMRDPFQVKGHELFASASVGLSLFPEDGEDAATLQKHADVAMYEVKNRGRNRFQRFAPEMNSASSERLEIENQLHWALDRGELQLYYQPQFQLPSRQLGGVEALLRWNHPKWGLVLPNRFVPVAEESGLIIPIGL